jgi:hypothetical protein
MTAALATYHVKPSAKYGWHYHCHLVVEFDDVVDPDSLHEGLDLAWRRVTSRHESHLEYKQIWMRCVTGPGPALVGMAENTQLEFWNEPEDNVSKVLHYVIRDVLQGVENWVLEMERKTDVWDFCDFMGTAKRHRTYGAWRKKVAGDETEAAAKAEETAIDKAVLAGQQVKGISEWTQMMTMDQAIREAKGGRSDLQMLIGSLSGCTNRSRGVSFRLKKLTAVFAT